MISFGISAGGTLHRLPEGASAITAPILRPLPGGGGRLLVGMLGASAVPAWVLPGAACPALAWVLVPDAEGALLLGGDALVEAGPAELAGAPSVPAPAYPPPRPRLVQAAEEAEFLPVPIPPRGGFRVLLPQPGPGPNPATRPATSPGTDPGHPPHAHPDPDTKEGDPGQGDAGPVAAAAAIRLDIPFAALARILPMPASSPAPHARPPATGLAWTAVGPVLVLDPACFGGGTGRAPLLAVIASAGRQFGIPCRGVTPLRHAPVLPALLSHPALLAAAPLARPPEAVAASPTRLFLIVQASGMDFGMLVEEVAAVLAPRHPGNRGRGTLAGIAAHRGEVLPVLDAGLILGRAPVLGPPNLGADGIGIGGVGIGGIGTSGFGTGHPVPMLRLAGPLPAVLAVSVVRGLRAVAEAEVAAVAGDGLVSHVVRLDGTALPVLWARALASVLAAPPGEAMVASPGAMTLAPPGQARAAGERAA